MTPRATVAKHMEEHIQKKNDEPKVKRARTKKLTLALTALTNHI